MDEVGEVLRNQSMYNQEVEKNRTAMDNVQRAPRHMVKCGLRRPSY
ncbi:1407_t:CDS:2 [Rhizophagus irregularis]|nr:1407_t:CDS:2 [Rhizophagus irregularis]